MKITVQNFLDEFPKINKQTSNVRKVIEAYPTAYEDFEFYNDDATIADSIDLFIEKLNAALAADSPTPPKNDKPTAPKRKYTTGKGKMKVTGRRKKGEPKPEKDTKKKTKKEKKTSKTKKQQVGENPAWLATLQSFVKSFAGKTKETWRVRKYVVDIQAKFSKKHGNATPNIDIIRDIQDKLIKYANSDERKVDIPEYTDLVAKCKKAIKEKGFTVSNKAKKPEIKTEELSGFRIGFSK